MHAFSTGRRGGERRVKDDELRPPLATLTTPAVKALWCACASSLFFRIPDVVAAVPRLCTVPVVVMVKLSKEAKQRLQQLFKGGQFAIRWGFIPLVIYLGQWEKNPGGDGRNAGVEAATPFLAFSGRRSGTSPRPLKRGSCP